MSIKTLFIEDISIGLTRSRAKTVTAADIAAFGAVSGDLNPVHFDEAFAAATPFGGVVAHGMLSAALISAVIGEDLPGHGAIYLGQTLKFHAPVRPGDVVVTQCRVADLSVEKRRLVLDCMCRVEDQIVLSGEATVLAPSRARLRTAA